MINATELYAAPLTGADWHKSTYTANNGQCVELAPVPTLPAVAIRDSKNLQIEPIRTSNQSMRDFAAALLAGELVAV
ncbi:DUF397 domain-containing protein [Kitasatospora sp. NPDC048296]|uniref:DUF397 domain-containing protein n=1 Tax=Kitasatospora sp. NPDC048296 TaxID=3364048 RepID=UPI003720B3E9